jgi:hypothetical protein
MLQKQLEYVHPSVLVDTQMVGAELNDPTDSIAVAGHDSSSRKEMKRERIKKTYTIFFAIVTVSALFAVSLTMASQHASAAVHHKIAVHHKAHTASTQVSTTVAVHHKATASKGKISVHQVAVIPEAHNNPDKVLANATAMKALLKGPYGDSIVIGGMTADGY